MKKFICSVFVSFMAILLVLGTVRCGGGKGGDAAPGEGGMGGSVTIIEPDSSGYETTCNSVLLSGNAFISPTWSGCCSGSAETLTGVTVVWKNETTGETGKANQSVEIKTFFSTPYLSGHTWTAFVPLASGSNVITITASDPSNRTGQETITVYKTAYSYSISGKIVNQNGIGVSGIKVTLENDHSSVHAYSGAGGTYTIDCVENGSYGLTPSSSIGFSFSTPAKTVIVSDSDVPGQDFVTEAYSLSGRVTYSNGAPVGGYLVSLTGGGASVLTATGSDGFYRFLVPNGTYTVEPSGWGGLTVPLSFLPENRAMPVDHADVAGQDFVH